MMANIYYKNGSTFTSILDIVYPVGSFYMSTDGTSPGSIVGGTWEPISDRFLYGTTSNIGKGGGSSTHNHVYGIYFYDFYNVAAFHQYALAQNGDGDPVKAVDYGTSEVQANSALSLSTKARVTQRLKCTTNTSSASSLPPYYSTYIWHRTA